MNAYDVVCSKSLHMTVNLTQLNHHHVSRHQSRPYGKQRNVEINHGRIEYNELHPIRCDAMIDTRTFLSADWY